MPKKKKSAAKPTVASNATTRVNASCTATKKDSADPELNEKLIRMFRLRMGTTLTKSETENGEKSHDSSDEEARCEEVDDNRENIEKISSIFENSSFGMECGEHEKESIKCLLQSKAALSVKRCLCDICDCEECKKKMMQRKTKEAERNATSLIAEEERKKKKVEKKKNQKKKRKQQKKVDERRKSNEHSESNKEISQLLAEQLHINQKEEILIGNSSKNKVENSEAKVDEKASTPSVSSSSEEEELNLNSAFVVDIAQRKSKANATSAIAIKSPFSETQYTVDFNESGDSFDDSDTICSQYSFSSKKGCNSTPNVYKKLEGKNGCVNQSLNNNEKVESSYDEDNVKRSVDIGAQANKEALNKNFAIAVELFKEAIELNPNDYRFYVNRSYCYDCLFDYESALKDAETAILLNHTWPKCYYRKGRALAGLRRYEEAEEAFSKVLQLEKYDCSEATSELLRVREEAVRQLGYDKQIAAAAASKYTSVREAVYSVVNCMVNVTREGSDECDSEDELILNANLNYPTIADKMPSEVTNPFGWKALWIGNLSPTADENVLKSMFCKYGVLSHCGLYPRTEGAYALVHYDNPESPRRAMAAYQGAVIKGISRGDIQELIIRFRPNRDQKQDKYQERIDIAECYYWRTTGCLRVDECHYLHIPANKGVDFQPWMNISDGKPRNRVKPMTKN